MADGNSDIKLQDGQVIIEAKDLCIDSSERRKNNTPTRRALVHDFDDGLTVNWDHDYPGGVTLQGLSNVHGHNNVTPKGTLFHDNLILLETIRLANKKDSRFTILEQGENGQLTVRQPENAQEGVVYLTPLKVRKVFKLNEYSESTRRRLGSGRLRPTRESQPVRRATQPQPVTSISMADQPNISNNLVVADNTPIVIDFDVAETFLTLMDELEALRRRVKELENKLNIS